MKDSLDNMVNSFESKKEEWKKALESQAMKSTIACVLNNRYFMSIVNKYMAFNDYHVNPYIDEIVHLIDSNTTKLKEVYLDSLPVEMLKKEISQDIKNMTAFLAFSKIELDQLQSEGKISNSEALQNYFNSCVANNYDSLIQVNREAVQNNVLLKHTLGKLTPYWDDTKNAQVDHKDLIKERYDFAVMGIEHENERQKSIFSSIIGNTTRWKSEFKVKK